MQKEEAHADSVERHYKNGATVRFLRGEPPKEPEPAQETLTEAEQAILETAINVDYLVCMKELEI